MKFTRISMAVAGALAFGAAVAACGANAAGAGSGGPSKAVIERLIEGYSGGETATKRFQFSDIQVAAPRVLQFGEVYGLKAGTRAWLVRATYSEFTSAGDVTASWSTCERSDNVEFYYIYKDEFGNWAQYATSHSGTVDHGSYHGPCPNMPGVGIFSTPMSSAQGGGTVAAAQQPRAAQGAPGMPAPGGAASPPATAPRAGAVQDPVLNGFQFYQQANYSGAVAAFQRAVQDKPHDTLAKVWLGLSQIASGDEKAGIFTLNFAADSIGPWSAETAELAALTYWRQGNIATAKSELGFCMNGKSAGLCAKMRQGIESGQQPPDVSAWPGIVGLVAPTQARATTWAP